MHSHLCSVRHAFKVWFERDTENDYLALDTADIGFPILLVRWGSLGFIVDCIAEEYTGQACLYSYMDQSWSAR